MKGDSTSQEVNPLVNREGCYPLPSGNAWSTQQNNATNANYTSYPAGSTNNNNKNNSYYAVPTSESISILDSILDAEDDCFKNKKSRIDACKIHYHLSELRGLIKDLKDGRFVSYKSLCFVLDYPTFREVFAAAYIERIVHHLCAPYIQQVTEKVHSINGDISHGNRKGHSALTAAIQLQERMKKYPNGIVVGFDIQGCFMHIVRELAWEVFAHYEYIFTPDGYTKEQREWLMWLIHEMIIRNPTENCEKHSPESAWLNIKPEKSLFNNPFGLPIGNFYAQLIANLLLALVDEILDMIHFVDDFGDALPDIESANRKKKLFNERTSDINLTMHPRKVYIQPVRHGIKICGTVVFPNRMYITNRVVHACNNKIDYYLYREEFSFETALKIVCCVNSYTGRMSKLYAFNIQIKLVNRVLESRYSKYIIARSEYNHLVLNIKPEYSAKFVFNGIYNKLTKIHKNYVWRSSQSRSGRYIKAGANKRRMGSALSLRTDRNGRNNGLH
mgnify:CR=1 FL=1